ncbi:MAG: spore coat protein CotH, partial [Verrucomicrobia bacterium]|nr:spore coat protein CotH [Verrucomicrobiota bacterium]
RFLALENVLVNTDGYWSRASDYNLYRHPSGRFHIIPHDINESFMRPEGPGSRGGGRGQDRDARPPGEAPPVAAPNGPAQLSPLVAEKDERKPLLSKLLAVPALRTRYLTHVKQIASQSLDWSQLGTAAERYHSLIAPHVSSDTRKLASTKQFESSLIGPSGSEADPGRGAPMSLKAFADQRRAFLLSLPELQALP